MKHKIPLQKARAMAEKLLLRLSPYCQRIEIAGSIRRQRPEIGDIELVAIPHFTRDLFDELTGDHQLNMVEWHEFGTVVKNGPKYKQIALREGVNIDLFIVTTPAQWGLIFLIRTGSAEFSRKLVTPRMHGGMMLNHLRVQDGAIWSSNHVIPTPEEQDVFDLLGMSYIEPKDRV